MTEGQFKDELLVPPMLDGFHAIYNSIDLLNAVVAKRVTLG